MSGVRIMRLTSLLLVLMLIVSLLNLPHIVYSQSSSSWREVIVMFENGDTARIVVEINSNIWDLTKPLPINIKVEYIKGSKPLDVIAVLNIKTLTEAVEVENKYYVGRLDNNVKQFTEVVQVYPSTKLVVAALNKTTIGLLITPSIIAVRGNETVVVGPTVPLFITGIIEKTGGIIAPIMISRSEVSYSDRLVLEHTVKTFSQWGSDLGVPVIEYSIQGYTTETIRLFVKLLVNDNVVHSKYVSAISGDVKVVMQFNIPLDVIKFMCRQNPMLNLKIETDIITENSKQTIEIPFNMLYELRKTLLTVEAYLSNSVYEGEKTNIILKITNNGGNIIGIKEIDILDNESLLKSIPVSKILNPYSETIQTIIMELNGQGTHQVKFKVIYVEGGYVKSIETQTYEVVVMPSMILNVDKQEVTIGDVIEVSIQAYRNMKGVIIQWGLNNGTWINITRIDVKVPSCKVKIKAPMTEGTYILRAIQPEKSIKSNTIEIKVLGKFTLKLSPSIIKANPQSIVKLSGKITPIPPREVCKIEVYRLEPTINDWILLPTATYTIDDKGVVSIQITAPEKPGNYKIKAALIMNNKKVCESNVVTLTVVEVKGNATSASTSSAGSGIIPGVYKPLVPMEMFVAIIATVALASIIVWRRFKR